MIFERTLIALAGAAAIAAAAGVAVVAAAFALYALMTPHLGPAGASAVVAACAAALVGLVGLIAANRRPHSHHPLGAHAPPDPSLLEGLAGLVRERPMLSAAAAVAAGVFAIRNPALLAAVLKAFTEPRPTHKG